MITDVMINRTEPVVTVTRGQGTVPSTVVENKTGDVIEFTATYPQAVTVDDTTGAGDAFNAGLAGYLLLWRTQSVAYRASANPNS